MQSALFQEHLLLGALMEEGPHGSEVVAAYGKPEDELSAFETGTALCDLSGVSAHLIEGADAERYMLSACAGKELSQGEACFEAVLTGDGAIASVPLVMRTGLHEYEFWDLSARADVLSSWLAFLSKVEGEGTPAFPNLSIEDVSDVFVPMLLWGPASETVLRDYLGTQELPIPGHVSNLYLDRIACIVASIARSKSNCFVVLVPPAFARVLWRSFLSFPIVTPVGRKALASKVRSLFPDIVDGISGTDRLVMPASTLRRLGLVRKGGRFVGARGLS